MTKTTKTLIGGTVAAGLIGGVISLYAVAGDDAKGDEDDLHASSAATALSTTASSDVSVVTTASRPDVVVWKSATCGCCKGWVTYLEDEGFSVTAHDTDSLDEVKTELGLTDPSLKSCHTATIDGYVIEGHVPISDIEKLLAERPDVVGLSAPGMPMMSPGMGSREPKDYDVISFAADGTTEIFSSH